MPFVVLTFALPLPFDRHFLKFNYAAQALRFPLFIVGSHIGDFLNKVYTLCTICKNENFAQNFVIKMTEYAESNEYLV